jgi:hypothetical protein
VKITYSIAFPSTSPSFASLEGPEAGANLQLNTLIRIFKHLNVSMEEFFKGM